MIDRTIALDPYHSCRDDSSGECRRDEEVGLHVVEDRDRAVQERQPGEARVDDDQAAEQAEANKPNFQQLIFPVELGCEEDCLTFKHSCLTESKIGHQGFLI